MATVTASYNWVSGETVTPAKLNTTAAPTVVVDDAEITNIKLASGIDASKLTTGTLPIDRVEDGAVTQAKLASGVGTPAGAVMAFAMNSAPAGWLAANGSNVSRSTYAALFAAISTTYGVGDGSTTFALPDLRGIFVRGSGSQTISDITYNKTFAAKENDALQAHTHSSAAAASGAQLLAGGVNGAAVSGSTTGAINTGRTDTETRPANIALLYCIKF
jgi:microcystin-dependent protein